ncbi:hypothetical protein FOXYSP1_16981 [Fusarium oxysporum f. sp. phaseoli]
MWAPKRLGDGIKVAIIGGGPAGLAAAIELESLPFVDWHLYEQQPTISEIGTGITLQCSTWKLLEKLGASKHLRVSDFFRPPDGHDYQYRDGISGVVVKQTHPPAHVAPHQAPCRVHRGKLQRALLKETNSDRIQPGMKLANVERLPCGKLHLTFNDGFTDDVDLLIGADGIRSAARNFAYPDYSVNYTGMTAYRAVVKVSDVDQVNGLSKASVFWYRTNESWRPTTGTDRVGAEKLAWLSSSRGFQEYCQPIQQLLSLVTRVKRFDYFGGRRLHPVVNHGSVALIGDASHPLSGAFGAGAAFALEDAHTLAGELLWAASSARGLEDSLNIFDDVRSPYYHALYQTMDDIAASHEKMIRAVASVEEEIIGRIENVSKPEHNWMYYHDVNQALENVISATEKGASIRSVL